MNFEEFLDTTKNVDVEMPETKVSSAPLVSVCVQTYQHVHFIKQCLDSILSQKTTFDFEILLGEDDSNDGTRDICLEYAKKYPEKIRLFLHHRNNNIKIDGRPTGRFNFLFNLFSTNGKYIALCEGDDYWTDPYKLQQQVDILENNSKYVICAHNAVIINIENESIRDFNPASIKQISGTLDLLESHWYIPTASIVFRKSRLKIPKELLSVINADYLLQLLLTSNGDKIFYLDRIMSAYRIHHAGLSQNFDRGSYLEDSLIRVNKVFDRLSGGTYKTQTDQNIAKFALSKLKKSKRWSADFKTAFSTYVRYNKKFSKQEMNFIIGHFILPKGWLSSK